MDGLLARDNNLQLNNVDDALSVIGSGLLGCIFTVSELGTDFFDLSNRIAGDVFQKFATYRYPIAIVLPDNHGLGDRVTELAREYAKHNCIRFCTTEDQAQIWLKSVLATEN